jgi:hypothetical protein
MLSAPPKPHKRGGGASSLPTKPKSR